MSYLSLIHISTRSGSSSLFFPNVRWSPGSLHVSQFSSGCAAASAVSSSAASGPAPDADTSAAGASSGSIMLSGCAPSPTAAAFPVSGASCAGSSPILRAVCLDVYKRQSHSSPLTCGSNATFSYGLLFIKYTTFKCMCQY